MGLPDVLQWFEDNLMLPPSIQDLETIMQALLNAKKIVETSNDHFMII
jgi:hypothetical protein